MVNSELLLVVGWTMSSEEGVVVLLAIDAGLIVKPRDAEWTVRA